MPAPEYRVVEDPAWGYRRLDPIPDSGDLARFYESRYCDLLRRGGRAPDLARITAGGAEAAREVEWLRATLYADILDAVSSAGPVAGSPRALDVGCGTGDFVAFLAEKGWQAEGLEPSVDIGAAGQHRGLRIATSTLEQYLPGWRADGAKPFAMVSLLNVLEHVPDPAALLRNVSTVTARDSWLVVRVPNDFNAFQLSAQKSLGKAPWWIAVPDHINYFTFASLRSFLGRLGWEVVCAQGDFPMELFLLMGEDYVARPELGRTCHEKRQRFELALPGPDRRAWYRALAEAGLGRNALIVARQGNP